MDCEPVSIEWVDDPDDWLLPVVAALDDASLCCVPPSDPDGTGCVARKHVLKIAVETRDPTSHVISNYRRNLLGGSFTWIHGCNFHLIAKQSVLRFSTRPFVHTRIGHWLHIKGWTWRVAVMLFLLVMALVGLQPGARIVNVPNSSDPLNDAAMLAIQMPSLVTISVSAAMVILMNIIAFQRTSRDLFIAAMFSFECLLITCSLAVSRSAWAYEQIALLSMAGELYWADVASTVIFVICISLPTGVALSCFDAFFMSQRMRALVLTFYVAHGMYSYFQFAHLTMWSNIEVCQWTFCASPKTVCVSAYANFVAFVAKLWFAYIRGDDCAILRTSYRRPGPATHCHLDDVCLVRCCCRLRDSVCSMGCCCRPRDTGCSIGCCCCRRGQARAEGNDGGVAQNPRWQRPTSSDRAERADPETSVETASTYGKRYIGLDSLIVCVQGAGENRFEGRPANAETPTSLVGLPSGVRLQL